MTKKEMLECCDRNKTQYKVTCFMIRMARLSKKEQKETWEWLESLNFKDDDDFITRIRWNVGGLYSL